MKKLLTSLAIATVAATALGAEVAIHQVVDFAVPPQQIYEALLNEKQFSVFSGVTTIVPRDEFARKSAPMQSERWVGGIDTVGGDTLATLFAQTAYEGAIACCGMAGGHELYMTVWPLILRNVALLAKRVEAWTRLANEIPRAKLVAISRTEPLSNIVALSEQLMGGAQLSSATWALDLPQKDS